MRSTFFYLPILFLMAITPYFELSAQNNSIYRTETDNGKKHNTTGPQDDPRIVKAVAIPSGTCDTLFINTKTACGDNLVINEIKLHSAYNLADYINTPTLTTDGIVQDPDNPAISYVRIPICLKSTIVASPYFVVEVNFDYDLSPNPTHSNCLLKTMHFPILVTNETEAKDTLLQQSNTCFSCEDKNNDNQLDDYSQCLAKPRYVYREMDSLYEFSANATAGCFTRFLWIVNETDTTEGENITIRLKEWENSKVSFTAINDNTGCLKMAQHDFFVQNRKGFNMYPNPATDNVMIRANKLDFAPEKVLVYDCLGRIVGSYEVTTQDTLIECEFSVQSYAAGIYHVVLFDKGIKIAKKLVVVR